MPFGLWVRSGSRNHELDEGPVHFTEGAILGERVAHCKIWGLSAMSCAEIDLLFRLWTRVGRSTLAPPGNTINRPSVVARCSFMSNYFDNLLIMLITELF